MVIVMNCTRNWYEYLLVDIYALLCTNKVKKLYLKIEDEKIEELISEIKNPYNRIIVGLIYQKTNRKIQARAIFDEFINQYPKMIITQDVKRLIK